MTGARITRHATDHDAGMSTADVYAFLVAVSRAGHFRSGRLTAVTGSDGQLLALIHHSTPSSPPPADAHARKGTHP